MKYPYPTTTIKCTVPGCGFFDEIELIKTIELIHGTLWSMPPDWDKCWTVNEDGGAVCPKHQEVTK